MVADRRIAIAVYMAHELAGAGTSRTNKADLIRVGAICIQHASQLDKWQLGFRSRLNHDLVCFVRPG